MTQLSRARAVVKLRQGSGNDWDGGLFFLIVKLRQGSGKDRQGLVIKRPLKAPKRP